MPKHAYLSASASHRWLACPPSAKLCANIADQTSEYAQQGTDCHELCAYLVEKALGRAGTDPTENLTFYDAEMQNCTEEYRNYVLEQIETAKEFCKDPRVMIEQRLDLYAKIIYCCIHCRSLIGFRYQCRFSRWLIYKLT